MQENHKIRKNFVSKKIRFEKKKTFSKHISKQKKYPIQNKNKWFWCECEVQWTVYVWSLKTFNWHCIFYEVEMSSNNND